MTIVGEPGVGKSGSCRELFAYIDRLAELISWRQGRCLPYGEGITFWALGEIVKSQAGILESDDPATAARKLDALVADDIADAPWLRQRLRPLVGLEAPEASREENFTGWLRYLELLAEDGPLIAVFEDLHWADEALLEFIEHVAEFAEGVPLLLIGTARPELHARVSWGGKLRNLITINLTPLSEADTTRLISNLLEQAVLPAEVQRAILERAGGNPLYAEEFVRLLKDRGILAQESGLWRLDASAEIPMPSGVQGMIAARIDTLDVEDKALLQDAAVIGKVFWSGAVSEIGDRDAGGRRATDARVVPPGARPRCPPLVDRGRARVHVLARARSRCRVRADPTRRPRRQARRRGPLDRAASLAIVSRIMPRSSPRTTSRRSTSSLRTPPSAMGCGSTPCATCRSQVTAPSASTSSPRSATTDARSN